MQHNQTVLTHRLDYRPFAYTVVSLDLCCQLHQGRTEIHATAVYHRKPQEKPGIVPLVLDGEGLELLLIKMDGRELAADRYRLQAHSLVVIDPPEKFQLEVATAIYPEKNTALEGLYRTGGNYCSQCEAQGFRKITYYPDRPDVLTRFTTRIEAERTSCPVMLANGNLVDAGLLADGRHFAVWEDPYPKPCYLFALVAGRLVALEDEFVTRSGRIVALKIFVEEHNREKCGHAMVSLQKAMRWDEEVFGLEYDLDIYMIVAVDDFNMGAMENKGLNIFNAKYVLASPETATDEDFLGIEGVIAHEYFHNWTGNRVTCRDWFQLSLKEGLTVFRDQQFSADMNSWPVQRIEDVRLLKNFQFREDAGPLAHPVRPDAYLQINNFYTATVYNKGAEVIRMMHTLLGPKAFRRGMDRYFARHDGQAVTCDDFVTAMADASGVSLEHFTLWYSQAGTPVLSVTEEWREEEREYRLRLRQSCPDNSGQSGKRPFHMPVAVGLLDGQGNDLLQGEPGGTRILELTEQEQLFTFQNIASRPVLSFLRDFSAPVRVAPFQNRQDLAHLMRHDTNLYNRWDSAQRLASGIILDNAAKIACQIAPVCDPLYLEAVSHSLSGAINDPALLALALQLPGETTLAQEMAVIDPEALHHARQWLKQTLAADNQERLMELYHDYLPAGEYTLSPRAIAERSLKNTLLGLLMGLDPLPEEIAALCRRQYQQATNMTDKIAALAALVQHDIAARDEALAEYYRQWAGDPLVLDKWFALQASSSLPGTLERVKQLTGDRCFSMANPNRVRALIGSFCSANHRRFHQSDGAGYRFLAEKVIELNSANPQIAARLVVPLTGWRRYDQQRQQLMREALTEIAAVDNLSRDVAEIISKSLEQEG